MPHMGKVAPTHGGGKQTCMQPPNVMHFWCPPPKPPPKNHLGVHWCTMLFGMHEKRRELQTSQQVHLVGFRVGQWWWVGGNVGVGVLNRHDSMSACVPIWWWGPIPTTFTTCVTVTCPPPTRGLPCGVGGGYTSGECGGNGAPPPNGHTCTC